VKTTTNLNRSKPKNIKDSALKNLSKNITNKKLMEQNQ